MLPNMGALPAPPTSRLEAVLRAGQQMSPTGATTYAAQQARDQQARAKAATLTSKGQDNLLVEAAQSIQQSKAATKERQAEFLQSWSLLT